MATPLLSSRPFRWPCLQRWPSRHQSAELDSERRAPNAGEAKVMMVPGGQGFVMPQGMQGGYMPSQARTARKWGRVGLERHGVVLSGVRDAAALGPRKLSRRRAVALQRRSSGVAVALVRELELVSYRAVGGHHCLWLRRFRRKPPPSLFLLISLLLLIRVPRSPIPRNRVGAPILAWAFGPA